jgi:glycosyltransferase involved in cell wall biosynthesis
VWRRREAGKRLVGYTTWETTRLQAHWIPLLNELDLVLVPSRWNARVFRRSGVTTPIRIVPHVYQPPPPEVAPLPGIDAGVMVFYTIGPWTVRKAPWRIVEAFRRAFSPEDPALLVIKADEPDWTRAFQGPLWRHAARRLFTSRRALRALERKNPSSPPVLLIDRSVPDATIQSLHARGDCYVSLASAEGWGLGAFDAAGRGRPVIMTGFGGQLDYLPASDAHLVEYRLEETARTTGRPAMPGSWAIPDVSHASLLMRRVFEDREASRLRGLRLGRHVVEHFSEPVVIERLWHALGRELPSRRQVRC